MKLQTLFSRAQLSRIKRNIFASSLSTTKTHNYKMPIIDFYQMPPSPPCRLVEMVGRIVGVTFNRKLINLFEGEHRGEEYTKVNPLQKIPVIVDGDLKLAESRAIATYLIQKYMPEDNTLYPKDPVKRAKVDELLYFDLSNLMDSARDLLIPVMLGKTKELDANFKEKLNFNLQYLDNILKEKKTNYLIGDQITVADLAVAATLSFIESFDFDISSHSQLKAYEKRLKETIPNYSEVNDNACQAIRSFVKSKQTQ